MDDYLFAAFSDPAPGRQLEYDRWYDEVHIRDVVDVPGVRRGRRYRLHESQGWPVRADQPQNLALYDLRTDDIHGTIAEFRSRTGTPQMEASAGRLLLHSAVFFRAVGPIVTSAD